MTSSGLRKSLDIVAAIEAAKGAIVLLVGFGLLGLLHRDLPALGGDASASEPSKEVSTHFPRSRCIAK